MGCIETAKCFFNKNRGILMIMVCEPYVVNFLNHMPIFEMYMARLTNKHHREMCCDEIESCILSLSGLINSQHKMGGFYFVEKYL